MSRFPAIKDPAERQELKAIYGDILDSGFGTRQGTPVNFFSGMSLRPDILGPSWALTKQMLVNGRLSPRIRQFATLAVSAHNGTHYCCQAHARALQGMGVDQAMIANAMEDPEASLLPAEEREAVRFVRKAAAAPRSVGAPDFHRLQNAGYGDADILEMVMLAAFANWTNTWADAADLLVD